MSKDQSVKTPEDESASIVEWGTISDAQKISGNESRAGIYRAIERGELIAAKRGRRTLVDLKSARDRARNFPRVTLKTAEGE